MPRLPRIALALLELAGVVAIVDGVWRVSIPAALVVAGVLVVVWENVLERKLK